jgi:hypothetical protein
MKAEEKRGVKGEERTFFYSKTVRELHVARCQWLQMGRGKEGDIKMIEHRRLQMHS